MSQLEMLESLQYTFSEFGFKTRYLRYNTEFIEAIIIYLKLNNCYTIINLIVYLAKYGIIEVIDIIDEVALQFIST